MNKIIRTVFIIVVALVWTGRAQVARRMTFDSIPPRTQSSYYDSAWTHEGAIAPLFPPTRKMLLDGTNHTHTAGWRLTACRTGTSAFLGNFIPPLYHLQNNTLTNWQASLQNTLCAKIESPFYPEGIEILYFDAINVFLSVPGELTVEMATNMLDRGTGDLSGPLLPEEEDACVYNWQTLDVVSLAAASSNDFTRYVRTINWRYPARFRIRRTGAIDAAYGTDSAFLAVDNIYASAPPSDVVIRKPDAVFSPGYLSAETTGVIRCYIDNVGTNDYAWTDYTSRTVAAHYRWRYLDQATSAWTTVSMAYVSGTGDTHGNGECYEAELPAFVEEGTLEYYFSCAFDGVCGQNYDYTEEGYVYPSESCSPRVLRGDTATSAGGEFCAPVRRYRSEYGALEILSDQRDTPVAMTLSGDNEWRGFLSLENGAVTNLSIILRGTGAVVSNAFTFSDVPDYWADPDASTVRPVPFAGYCDETNSKGRLHIRAEGGRYVMVTFNTRTKALSVCRADYQDFNRWTAPEETFTESSGQATTQRFQNMFIAWPTDEDGTVSEYFIGDPSQTDVFQSGPFSTFNGWQAGSAAYVLSRGNTDLLNRPDGTESYQNRALRLKGGTDGFGLGYIHNLYATRTDGLKSVSFCCHLGQPIDSDEITYYQGGFLRSNYAVTLNVQALSISPESPSLSAIGYYQGRDTFYEYRVTAIRQESDPSKDKRLKHELYKWINGSCYLLESASPASDQVLTAAKDIEIRFYNVLASKTVVVCSYASSDVLYYADTGQQGGSPIQSGTVGFLAADCQGLCSQVKLYDTSSTYPYSPVADTLETVLDGSSSAQLATDSKNWSLPAGRFVAQTSGTPYGLCSVLPTQRIGIFLQASDRDSEETPAVVGSSAWKEYAEFQVTNFIDTAFSLPVYSWQSQFVMLRVLGRSDALAVDTVIDALHLESWRGRTVSDSGAEAVPDWLATEAWVTTNETAGCKVVQFDQTRADPDAAQALRSPLLTNGLGVLEFDYRVARGPARWTVQYALENDAETWQDVTTFLVDETMDEFQHALVYAGISSPGYLRLLTAREDDCTNAVIELRQAAVWDEPAVDESSWKAYNARITEFDSQRVWLDESKVCSLNNSTTQDAVPVQDQSKPFLQSPQLVSGLGSLSFLARAFDTNQAAVIDVYASTNGWDAPEADWFKIHTFDGITNLFYHPFQFTVSDGVGYDAVRLVAETNGLSGRVCIENVAIGESMDAVLSDVPSVAVIVSSGPFNEAMASGEGSIRVRLTSAFTNAVTVRLEVSPTNSLANGSLNLAETEVTFPAGVVGMPVETTVSFSGDLDGTQVSAHDGFLITPVVAASEAAQVFYGTNLISARVFIQNISPEFVFPLGVSLSNATYTVSAGTELAFSWSVSDVAADATSAVGTGLKVMWNFGDGSTQEVVWGTSGSLRHIYRSVGDFIVQTVAQDKDEDSSEMSQFLVCVTGPVTSTTPVPVPYAWLKGYSTLVDLAGSYEEAAYADADGDGQAAWQEYVSGTVPTNRDSVFRTRIVLSNGVPSITWSPDLGNARVYTVEGKTNLNDTAWGPRDSGTRFFRVKVQLP